MKVFYFGGHLESCVSCTKSSFEHYYHFHFLDQ